MSQWSSAKARRVLAALIRIGWNIKRESSSHKILSAWLGGCSARILTLPRHNPVNAFTMGGIARDAGLTIEQFRKLL